MKVVVTGGRDFEDQEVIDSVLDTVNRSPGITCLYHGTARGADRACGEWAKKNGVEVIEVPADWECYGNSAGAIRNTKMLTEASARLLISFPGGFGTADCTRKAASRGMKIMQILADGSVKTDVQHWLESYNLSKPNLQEWTS